MAEAKERVIETLELALKTETEGRDFYLEAARKNSNELGRKIFESLADQEMDHFVKIKEIYELLRSKEEWPEVTPLKHKTNVKTVFSRAIKTLGTRFVVSTPDIEALQSAKELEDRSYKLYHNRSEQATGVEKRFYDALAAEERGHYLVIEDSLEYLTDPHGWFVKKERHSLDGG